MLQSAKTLSTAVEGVESKYYLNVLNQLGLHSLTNLQQRHKIRSFQLRKTQKKKNYQGWRSKQGTTEGYVSANCFMECLFYSETPLMVKYLK